MTWESEPLRAKARLFFDKAFREQDEPAVFGLWCSLALELLIRSAVAYVNPILLAATEKNEYKNVLFALGKNSSPLAKSVAVTDAINLCQLLFDGRFTADDASASRTVIMLRNEELHSGSAPFERVPPKVWLPGLCRACKNLCAAMEESLESLLDADRAKVIEQLLDETEKDVKSQVMSAISDRKKMFATKSSDEQKQFVAAAARNVAQLVHQHHHKVNCPACDSHATVEGDAFGNERVEHDDENEQIVVRRTVTPRRFSCGACGLILTGYAELSVAELGGFYTRTSYYTPEEYYGFDPGAIIDEYEREAHDEYDNE